MSNPSNSSALKNRENLAYQKHQQLRAVMVGNLGYLLYLLVEQLRQRPL